MSHDNRRLGTARCRRAALAGAIVAACAPTLLAFPLTEDVGIRGPGSAQRWRPPAEPWVVAGTPRHAPSGMLATNAAAIRVLVPIALLARTAGALR